MIYSQFHPKLFWCSLDYQPDKWVPLSKHSLQHFSDFFNWIFQDAQFTFIPSCGAINVQHFGLLWKLVCVCILSLFILHYQNYIKWLSNKIINTLHIVNWHQVEQLMKCTFIGRTNMVALKTASKNVLKVNLMLLSSFRPFYDQMSTNFTAHICIKKYSSRTSSQDWAPSVAAWYG